MKRLLVIIYEIIIYYEIALGLKKLWPNFGLNEKLKIVVLNW